MPIAPWAEMVEAPRHSGAHRGGNGFSLQAAETEWTRLKIAGTRPARSISAAKASMPAMIMTKGRRRRSARLGLRAQAFEYQAGRHENPAACRPTPAVKPGPIDRQRAERIAGAMPQDEDTQQADHYGGGDI